MLSTGNFPDITPVFKKKDPLKKENYRPGSALSAISKIFEKLMQKQVVGYIEKILPHTYVAIKKFIRSKRC